MLELSSIPSGINIHVVVNCQGSGKRSQNGTLTLPFTNSEAMDKILDSSVLQSPHL